MLGEQLVQKKQSKAQRSKIEDLKLLAQRVSGT